jgi:hypothetical protein
MAKDVFWCGNLGASDDFGRPYGKVMYDGKTRYGPWANMSEESWLVENGTCGQVGLGLAQKYELQADGRWKKVEG